MILIRGLDRYSSVARSWIDKTVVLIAGGPSLTFEQVETVRKEHESGKVKCIAVNDAYLWTPWADVLYAADASWHNDHTKGIAKPTLKLSAGDVAKRFADFKGQKCSIQSQEGSIKDDATHILRNACLNSSGQGIHCEGLSRDQGAIVTGWNSGFQALNVAVLAGGNPIILLGFDGQVAKDGRTHFSGGHSTPTPEAAYALYRRSFSAAERDLNELGVKVFNCSPGTAIDAFPKVDLRGVLCELGTLPA